MYNNSHLVVRDPDRELQGAAGERPHGSEDKVLADVRLAREVVQADELGGVGLASILQLQGKEGEEGSRYLSVDPHSQAFITIIYLSTSHNCVRTYIIIHTFMYTHAGRMSKRSNARGDLSVVDSPLAAIPEAGASNDICDCCCRFAIRAAIRFTLPPPLGPSPPLAPRCAMLAILLEEEALAASSRATPPSTAAEQHSSSSVVYSSTSTSTSVSVSAGASALLLPAGASVMAVTTSVSSVMDDWTWKPSLRLCDGVMCGGVMCGECVIRV